ncbi:polyprenyl synthetase family protein [bacterium]|nr:polyprenyl synthetase family protein [candidate division CSSED10-310 bacterium]
MSDNSALRLFLEKTSKDVKNILLHSDFVKRLPIGVIKERILDYSVRGGKCLRPALVLASTGVVGGTPDDALGIAVAIEMFHTWTLVHDDIIDRDRFRRGGLTIHAQIYDDFSQWNTHDPGIPRDHLAHSLAILVGDAQHGLVMDLMANAGLNGHLDPGLILHLIAGLEGDVLPALLSGEVSDVLQTGIPLESIEFEDIEIMLRRKTGALIAFSALAGGMIGLNCSDRNHPFLQSLDQYGISLGLAFQLRDDILGILGDQTKLGKPIGSDFREGKRTLAIKIAFDRADKPSKLKIKKLLGKSDLTLDEYEQLKQFCIFWGGVDEVESWARKLIDKALQALVTLPDNQYRYLLQAIAEYTVNRQK